ncbi:hypothetical protein CKO45_08930 [Paracraurococcus ruber]|uniref:Uncharacterized protein n=1 Tax=Paracraurococcus ruber TaxID=77675 RepID=A0ABS1CVH8_9PROT|nr:hypothetical protein [Paracraurococcus ruber]
MLRIAGLASMGATSPGNGMLAVVSDPMMMMYLHSDIRQDASMLRKHAPCMLTLIRRPTSSATMTSGLPTTNGSTL